MKYQLLIATGLLAALACAVLTACGDDDDAPATPTPTVNPSSDPNAAQQLLDLAEKWAEADAAVTYTLSNVAGDAEVAVYRRGPETRIDHTLAKTTTVIVRSDGGYSCSSESNSCALLTAEDAKAAAGFIPFVTALADEATLGATIAAAEGIEEAPGRRLAGRDTACVTVSGVLAGIPGPSELCFDEDGLLLFVGYAGQQSFQMSATEVRDLQDGELDPPYVVVTIPPSPTP
jgi:hypothetical protein